MIDPKTNQTSNQRDWLDIGENYDLIRNNYYKLAIVRCNPSKRTKTKILYRKEEIQIAEEWLQEQLPLKVPNVAIFKEKRNDELVLIFQSKNVSLESILQSLSTKLKNTIAIDLRFYFGNAYHSFEGIPNSFIEAKTALEEAKQISNTAIINYYRPKGLIELFENTSEGQLHYYCKKVLKSLAYPTEQSTKALRKTLKYYLDYNCEITKTAKILFLHRNTIKYRIKQCEQLLGVKIKNPKDSLNLRLALELSETENKKTDKL